MSALQIPLACNEDGLLMLQSFRRPICSQQCSATSRQTMESLMSLVSMLLFQLDHLSSSCWLPISRVRSSSYLGIQVLWNRKVHQTPMPNSRDTLCKMNFSHRNKGFPFWGSIANDSDRDRLQYFQSYPTIAILVNWILKFTRNRWCYHAVQSTPQTYLCISGAPKLLYSNANEKCFCKLLAGHFTHPMANPLQESSQIIWMRVARGMRIAQRAREGTVPVRCAALPHLYLWCLLVQRKQCILWLPHWKRRLQLCTDWCNGSCDNMIKMSHSWFSVAGHPSNDVLVPDCHPYPLCSTNDLGYLHRRVGLLKRVKATPGSEMGFQVLSWEALLALPTYTGMASWAFARHMQNVTDLRIWQWYPWK